MGNRRKAREYALQMLYQTELNPAHTRLGYESLTDEEPLEDDAIKFSMLLVEGTLKKQEEIDQIIKRVVKNWDMNRLSAIDRNIIRMGAFEMFFLSVFSEREAAIPNAVTINEAVEIAKKFSTPDSGKFVNGVLDELRKEYLKQAKP